MPANAKSDSSRSDFTLALYELRVQTRNTGLFRLAEEAVDANYAVKHRGQDLAAVTAVAMDARRERGLAAGGVPDRGGRSLNSRFTP